MTPRAAPSSAPAPRRGRRAVPRAARWLREGAGAASAQPCPMASPAAAGPGAALPAGAARRDFYWLRSFIAGGGCPGRALAAACGARSLRALPRGDGGWALPEGEPGCGLGVARRAGGGRFRVNMPGKTAV